MSLPDDDPTAPTRWRAEAAELRSARWRGWPRRVVGWAFQRQLLIGDELTDFRHHAWALTSGFERLTAAFASLLLLGLWPLDVLIYPGDGSRVWLSAAWRAAAACILVGCIRASEERERANRNPIPVWVAACAVVVTASYLVAGSLGDPSTPWIHTSLLVPFLSVTILVRLVHRAAITFGLAATAMLAYFLPHLGYLRSPYVAAIFGTLVAACVMSVVLGHALYVLTRREFEARLDLRRLSRTDPLTSVWNRSYFLERAEAEVLRARRSEVPLAVLVMDLDRFKAVNDGFGHAVGDKVLRDFVARTAKHLRRTDVLGRMGGEEFAVLLIDTPLVTAVDVAERLRREVEDARPVVDAESGLLPRYTVSVGCAALHHDDDGVEAVLRRADLALYQAKGFGRNRVVSESSQGPIPIA